MKTVRLRKIGSRFTLTPYTPEFEKWVSSFENTNNKFKNTLKNLAK
ncbi:MAG: hypothetical protein K9L17_11830 [Clostridiales bacterium]|nr:hypothetical protein [Clostridiales bacterium]